jgi:pterin-4a-carbinolamine dehydratase
MPAEYEPFVFISYRRQDSSAAARWLNQIIQRAFGVTSVFVDTETIRTGEDWSERIIYALQKATILIVIIGPHWLRITDMYGRRRIDKEDDWVHSEILHAINNNLTIIPLLLSNTPLPEKAALPKRLEKLTRYQAFDLRDDRWEPDLNLLLSRLEQLGFTRKTERPVRYPKPRITLNELSRDEINEALKLLPDWKLITSEIPGREPLKQTEFKKMYEFASFEDAIHFMGASVEHISQVNHHPRWENIWRTVTVWLSTWDIGHRPSRLDIELAKYLDDLYKGYPPPKERVKMP